MAFSARASTWFALATVTAAVLSYQACSEFTPLQRATLTGLSTGTPVVARVYKAPPEYPNLLFWWNAQDLPSITVDEADSVEILDWQDSNLEWTLGPRQGTGPSFVANALSGLPALRFNAAAETSLMADPHLPSTSDSFTIAVVLSRVSVGSAVNIGSEFDVNAVEIVAGSGGAITAREVSTAGNSASLTFSAPVATGSLSTGSFSATVAIARFGSSPNDIALWVNGYLADTAPTVVGSPTGLARVARQVRLAGPTKNFEGDIAEIVVFPRKLTDPEAVELSAYLAQKWRISGATTPPPGPTPPPPPPPAVVSYAANVAPILATSCLSCHSTANAAALGGGRILEGFTNASTHATRMAARMNNSSDPMPPTGGLIDGRTVITAWIAGGKQP